MWNWLVGALVTGCTLVLYDGSPFQPTPLILWDLVDSLKLVFTNNKLTVFTLD